MVVPGIIMVMMIKANSSRVPFDLNFPSTKAMAEPASTARTMVETDTITELRKFR